jgi:hypothetical protein
MHPSLLKGRHQKHWRTDEKKGADGICLPKEGRDSRGDSCLSFRIWWFAMERKPFRKDGKHESKCNGTSWEAVVASVSSVQKLEF